MAISGNLDSRHEYPSNLNGTGSETPATRLTYRKGVLVCSYTSGNGSVSRSNSNINSSSSSRQPPPLPLIQKTQSSSVSPSSSNTKSNSSSRETNIHRTSGSNNSNSNSSSPNSTLINSSCTCSPGNTRKTKSKDHTTNFSTKTKTLSTSTPTCNTSQKKNTILNNPNSTNRKEIVNSQIPNSAQSKGESPICTRKYSEPKNRETNKEANHNHKSSSRASTVSSLSSRPKTPEKLHTPVSTSIAENHRPVSAKESVDSNKLASFPSSSCTRNTESSSSSSSMACVNQNRSQQNHHNRHHSHSNLYENSMGHNHNHNNQNHSYFDFDYDHISNLTQSLQNNTIHNHNQHNTNNGFLHNHSNNISMSQNQNSSRESRLHQHQAAKPEFIPSFVLVDACKANNERKVREIVRKLSSLESDDVEPVANFQDNTGRTALSYACASGNIMIIEELSKLRRLDSNLADNEGMAPLHYCSQAGHSEAVDLMLSRFEGNVDPNVRNATGLTPLMKAALQGRTRCAKSLLAAGASSHLRDFSRNLTAAEWATLTGRHICAEIINRSAKDNFKATGSPPANFPHHVRTLPGSQNGMELKRMNSDDSPYYHLYARNTVSGATWLKNKIKKALGASGAPVQYSTHHSNGNSVRSLADRRPTVTESTYGLMSNLSGATICAGSLLLPSIKPLIEQQRAQPRLARKMTIPTLQVTPVKR